VKKRAREWIAHATGVAVLVGAWHCDSGKKTHASKSAALAQAPAEWFACSGPDECVVVPEGRCCTPCDPVAFQGYTAVNTRHRADFARQQGCATTPCPACPAPDPRIPRSDSNFFALCREGRCVAVDLRYSAYSACKTHADCRLKHGTTCCDGCGDNELVTFNPASTLMADLCPVKPECPPPSSACLANRSPGRAAECVVGYCQLADN
jgi:hypothetical protein